MKKNRVKQIRTKLKLSQRALAAAVGTSQQQIQRIETGAVAARLDLATKLCKALGEPVDKVFPGSGKVMEKLQTEFENSTYIPTKTYSELSEHGVEADAAVWHLKILLRGHENELIFEIPPAEQRRIYRAVQREADALSFVVFDTEDACIAINLGEVVYCHFLFDVGVIREEEEGEEPGVRIYFSGSTRCFEFDPEIDEPDSDDEGDEGDFGNIFRSLETGPERYERYRFTDVDGEDVFLRAGDISLLQVPLWVIKPELLDTDPAEDDDDGYDEAAESRHRESTAIDTTHRVHE
jgi:DNA-binding XRE family transcriptional regulator